MSIPLSTEGLANFLKQNDALVTQIREAIEAGEDGGHGYSEVLREDGRGEGRHAGTLEALGPNVKFVVAKSSDVRATQDVLLKADQSGQ